MKKIWTITGIIALVCAVAVGIFIGVIVWYSQPCTGEDDSSEYVIDIAAGDTVLSVAQELEANHVIRSAQYMYYYARLTNGAIKAGRYNVSPSQTVKEILSMFQDGRQTYVRVTVPEGFTISKIAALLDEAGVTDAAAFIEAARNQTLLAEYAVPSASAEGYLFPDTYFFTPDMSAESVLGIFFDNFFRKLSSIDEELVSTPGRLKNVVILASIIEREYRDPAEAPIIASVFTNRMRYNIGLESCATVEYIITEIENRPHPDVITGKDLAIDSPYNTYKWAGLPPGPICSPGLVALSAAAFPAKTDFYYFRLVDPAKGNHYFSKTLSEHISAGQMLYTKKAAGK